MPATNLQQNDHSTAHHVGYAVGHETIAKPEKIRQDTKQETHPHFVAQQVKGGKCEQRRRPVATVILKYMFS